MTFCLLSLKCPSKCPLIKSSISRGQSLQGTKGQNIIIKSHVKESKTGTKIIHKKAGIILVPYLFYILYIKANENFCPFVPKITLKP